MKLLFFYSTDVISDVDKTLYEKNKTKIELLISESKIPQKSLFGTSYIFITSAILGAMPSGQPEQFKYFKLNHGRVILPEGDFVISVWCMHSGTYYQYKNVTSVELKVVKGEKYTFSCFKEPDSIYAQGKVTKLIN